MIRCRRFAPTVQHVKQLEVLRVHVLHRPPGEEEHKTPGFVGVDTDAKAEVGMWRA